MAIFSEATEAQIKTVGSVLGILVIFGTAVYKFSALSEHTTTLESRLATLEGYDKERGKTLNKVTSDLKYLAVATQHTLPESLEITARVVGSPSDPIDSTTEQAKAIDRGLAAEQNDSRSPASLHPRTVYLDDGDRVIIRSNDNHSLDVQQKNAGEIEVHSK